MSVEEALAGISASTTTVPVPFEEVRNGDGGWVNSTPWLSAKISKNSPVTVAIARERAWPLLPGELVVATSSQRDLEIIRFLTHEAQELRSSPDLVFSWVASLSGSQNPSLTGFLFWFIRGFGPATNGPYSKAQMASLYADLLASLRTSDTLVSLASTALFPHRLTTFYPDASTDTQIKMVQTLVEYAQSKDPYLARDALSELSAIAEVDHSFQNIIPPSLTPNLQRAYRQSVDNGRMAPSVALEETLGLKNNQ